MTLDELKKLIENPEMIDPKRNENVVNTEVAFERYVQRLYLIGLRLHGVGYKQAQEFVSKNIKKPIETLNTAMKLIMGEKYLEYEKAQSLNDLKALFDNFSHPLRNQVAHGKSSSYNEKTILLCIRVNIGYICEIEEFLRRKCKHSTFAKSTEWGAGIVRKKLTGKELEKFGKIKAVSCWKEDKAQERYNNISFLNSNNFLTKELEL